MSLSLRGEKPFHRRDALWNAGAAANPAGPLLDNIPAPDHQSPLKMMSAEERLVADFRGTGMTVGPHPMAYHRSRMDQLGVRRASELGQSPSGRKVRTAGCVIARQRPGTAKGFLFLSLEDETGVSPTPLSIQIYFRRTASSCLRTIPDDRRNPAKPGRSHFREGGPAFRHSTSRARKPVSHDFH